MRIAVDFDGTIVEHKYPQIGKTRLFAFETLKQLQKKGHDLILWTSRYGPELDEAVEFCKNNGVEFYAVNKNFPEENYIENEVGRKIVADIYIDDRIAGGFPGWSKIWEIIFTDENEFLEREVKNKLNKPNISEKISNLFKKR
jgi:hydroxymethylpyrimidine pyrophosphatase-like HAD family hydrolase